MSPEQVGEVVEANADVAPESRVSWYWVMDVKVAVWAADIEMLEVVTVPVVATLLAVPESIFQDDTL